MRPLLLDLFCGAGGCAMGYHRAGFEVVGVDIELQPHYPFKFIRADALEYLKHHGREYEVIHASPPCQNYSAMNQMHKRKYPQLIEPVRELLIPFGMPYIIENVPGAPLINPTMLCGSMFALQTRYGNQLRRHRLFETNFSLPAQLPCSHNDYTSISVNGGGFDSKNRKYIRVPVIGVYGHIGGASKRDAAKFFTVQDRREAMGIDWMTNKELVQAVPPAYTEYIGRHLLRP